MNSFNTLHVITFYNMKVTLILDVEDNIKKANKELKRDNYNYKKSQP